MNFHGYKPPGRCRSGAVCTTIARFNIPTSEIVRNRLALAGVLLRAVAAVRRNVVMVNHAAAVSSSRVLMSAKQRQKGFSVTEDPKKQSGDASLGMGEEISRRDFMNATLLASGGALLSGLSPYQLMAQMGKDNWTGYGGVGDYAESHGNTYDVMMAGHQIRDHIFGKPPQEAEDTGEIFDFVVVGGGLSGLATALYVQQQAPRATCLVLENHPIFGGEAKQNEFLVDGQTLLTPQGSDHFSTPLQ